MNAHQSQDQNRPRTLNILPRHKNQTKSQRKSQRKSQNRRTQRKNVIVQTKHETTVQGRHLVVG